MSSSITLNVALQHIGQTLTELAELKDTRMDPLEWSAKIIDVFLDFWNFQFKQEARKDTQRIAQLFNDFILKLDSKMDISMTPMNLFLGYICALIFILDLHIKVCDNIEIKPGRQLQTILETRISEAHLAESVTKEHQAFTDSKAESFSVEEVIIQAMQREIKTDRIQKQVMTIVKQIAQNDELEKLSNLLGGGIQKSKKYTGASSSNINKFISEKAYKTGLREFTFGEPPLPPRFSQASPNFGGNLKKEVKLEHGQRLSNESKLNLLMNERLKKVESNKKPNVPMHPVMQTFGDNFKPYPRYSTSSRSSEKIERFDAHWNSSRSSKDSGKSPGGQRRSLASSSHRMHKAFIHEIKETQTDGKHLLSIINCRDFDHFLERLNRRMGVRHGRRTNSGQLGNNSSPYRKLSSQERMMLAAAQNDRQSPSTCQLDVTGTMDIEAQVGQDSSSDFSESDDEDKGNPVFDLTLDDWDHGAVIALATPPPEYDN